MSLDNEIMKYLSELDKDQKKSVLSVIKGLLNKKSVASSGSQRLTIEQYNKELAEAEARIDAGEFYTQEEVEEMAKKW